MARFVNNTDGMRKYPIKCPLCEKIRFEYLEVEPKIMLRIYCQWCIAKMREEDF